MAPAAARETAADSTAIADLGTSFSTAWNAGDAAGLTQLVAEDYYGVEPDGSVVDGRNAYETMATADVTERAGSGMTLAIDPRRTVFLNGTNAVSAGTWTLGGLPAGAPPVKGSYIVVATKGTEGTWLIKSSLAAEFVPPPPTPPAASGRGGS
jgi:uncharacterized protein (TIGR02246 family)